MMDVLEHIKDDIGFMKKLKKYQKEDTIIFMTVPAFQSLYSLHDEQLHHFRRYDRRGLEYVLEQSGYTIIEWSYFYLSLIPLRCLTMKKTQSLGMWGKDEKDFLTCFIRKCLNMDFMVLRFLSKHRIHIGGLSLMVICKMENGQAMKGRIDDKD